MTSETALPSLDSLIKPDQVHQIQAIPAAEKDKYVQGVKAIWDILNSTSPDDAEYVKQHKKLVGVTTLIKNMIKGHKQGTAGASRPPGNESFSEAIIAQVRKLNIIADPRLWAKLEEAKANVNEQRYKYASQCQKLEQCQTQLHAMAKQIAARNEAGKPLSPEETQNATTRKVNWDRVIRETREWLFGFEQQQERWKAQQQHMNNDTSDTRGNQPPSNAEQPSTNAQRITENAGNQSSPQPQVTNQQNGGTVQAGEQAESGKNQNLQSRPPVTSSATVSAGPMPTSQNFAFPSQSSSVVAPLAGAPTTSLNPNIPSANLQQYQAPHAQPPPVSAAAAGSQVPHPLSHKAAIAQAARSYSSGGSQPLQPRANSQSSGHPPPNMPQPEAQSKNPHLPIPPKLSISPLQPVQMGSARPTLSGGPSTGAAGPMGQPGIQKYPYFVLDGEGERVLSKKKLEELVRQVTGGSDGEGGESLDPDVEETLLDVADEFVDNVIIAACRLAKLRSSATLELRDLQLILERNYNIRVPGYASDELRTVKKIQPTQAWTQKLSAVQAAKVTGGKTDI